MAEETAPPVDPRDLLSLKLLEAEVSTDDPWGDDELGREEIAQRLTNIVIGQTSPFVISLHGAWGTGKTFMLKRWRRQLEKDGLQAIYFNAWQDDFFDDPLLAILGHLYDHFADPNLKESVKTLFSQAAPLVKANISGVLSHLTGLTLDASAFKQEERDLLDEYEQQRKTKEELKQTLAELSAKVVEETGHPLVFIIDELDRCRPTFAIELLERVKHIFDVPNIVFVLGINRDELCQSLKLVYGEINADTYLRRFFDMEFTLPPVDTTGFARYLFRIHGLPEYHDLTLPGKWEFSPYVKDIPPIWALMRMSLRDIEHCVRLNVLVAKRLEAGQNIHPYLLGILVPLKIIESTLYREYISGECTGGKVMNWVDQFRTPDLAEETVHTLDMCEATLYAVDNRFAKRQFPSQVPLKSPALDQLERFKNKDEVTRPEFLSDRAKTGRANINRIIELMKYYENTSGVVSQISDLIDFHHDFIRQ